MLHTFQNRSPLMANALTLLVVLCLSTAGGSAAQDVFLDGFEGNFSSWSSAKGSSIPVFAGEMLATTLGEYEREYAGFSELPAGGVASLDSSLLGTRAGMAAPGGSGTPRFQYDSSLNPGGAALILDAYDPPAPLAEWMGVLTGLAVDSSGILWATTCSLDPCDESVSNLLRIDVETFEVSDLGVILDSQGGVLNGVTDLALQPGTDTLYAATDFGNCGDGDCLYRVNTQTAQATLVGEVDTPWLGGIAFANDGTLFAVAAAAPNFSNDTNRVMLIIDPDTAQTVSTEPMLLEQQFEVPRGGNASAFDVRSLNLQALGVDSSGRLVAARSYGGMSIYRREQGTVKDKFGDLVTGEQTWVWKLLGDAGEPIGDIAFR